MLDCVNRKTEGNNINFFYYVILDVIFYANALFIHVRYIDCFYIYKKIKNVGGKLNPK
jgi:hypothetical protein